MKKLNSIISVMILCVFAVCGTVLFSGCTTKTEDIVIKRGYEALKIDYLKSSSEISSSVYGIEVEINCSILNEGLGEIVFDSDDFVLKIKNNDMNGNYVASFRIGSDSSYELDLENNFNSSFNIVKSNNLIRLDLTTEVYLFKENNNLYNLERVYSTISDELKNVEYELYFLGKLVKSFKIR